MNSGGGGERCRADLGSTARTRRIDRVAHSNVLGRTLRRPTPHTLPRSPKTRMKVGRFLNLEAGVQDSGVEGWAGGGLRLGVTGGGEIRRDLRRVQQGMVRIRGKGV